MKRQVLRGSRCLENLPYSQIAECNEIVVAKLARIDYPSLWLVNNLSRDQLLRYCHSLGQVL